MPDVREPASPSAARHAYSSILVHAEPELTSSPRVEVAARLARHQGARLIGVGAEALEPLAVSDPYDSGFMAGATQARRDELARRFAAAEHAFLRDAAGADVAWRALEAYPNDALVSLSRAADLIVISAAPRGAPGYRTANPADVVIRSGRPVLVVPEGGRHLRGERVVVAWKACREARRALADALPLLQQAQEVIVHAVVPKDGMDLAAFEVRDVVEALSRRGVNARPSVSAGREANVPEELHRIADLNGADLIVAGAYGHSRAAEWVFGGVSEALLHRASVFVLMSH